MSKDKPFRELQFSSAQLIVVFLAILVLGVFIFLLGISVGKKQIQLTAGAGAAGASKTETVAPKTPIFADAAAAAKTEESKPLDKPVEMPAVKPADKPGAKLSDTPADKPADAKPVVTPKGVTAPTTTKPILTKPAAAEAEDAKPKGRFYVQIGAGGDKPAAKAFGERVELLGFPSRVFDPLAADKKTVFRVRIGPYETKAAADDAQGKVAAALKKKKTDFFIVVD
jgi:cell division protein FtsN